MKMQEKLSRCGLEDENEQQGERVVPKSGQDCRGRGA